MNRYIDFNTIKSLALESGFQDCGAIEVGKLDISFFNKWINAGYNADMQYLNKYVSIRENPELLLENSKSIISFIVSYNIENADSKNNKRLKLASYSLFNDYHKSIKQALNRLILCIQDIYPDFKGTSFVDSAPIFEKVIAKKSGLGWIGKNSILINKTFGSRILIGEIICNYSTDYNNSIEEDLCKNCYLCKNACPNGAICDNSILDANLCNSYQTIENKNNIPNNINLKNYILGCDICLNVCPWNNKASIKESKILSLNSKTLELIEKINNEEYDKSLFNQAKKNSPLDRIKFDKLLSNIEKAKTY
ncbi:MAG: tRNA epoxyqueuosine(34) reductase QueG [Bacteroidales bacterium]|nr:tRNA epoxyqueuosine(34) reductase QueG [Bacteroidales bacterium]MDD4703176.1 tRNA epoxyqueuosine(34) reductase QueG [Bacteroidales bacterium]